MPTRQSPFASPVFQRQPLKITPPRRRPTPVPTAPISTGPRPLPQPIDRQPLKLNPRTPATPQPGPVQNGAGLVPGGTATATPGGDVAFTRGQPGRGGFVEMTTDPSLFFNNENQFLRNSGAFDDGALSPAEMMAALVARNARAGPGQQLSLPEMQALVAGGQGLSFSSAPGRAPTNFDPIRATPTPQPGPVQTGSGGGVVDQIRAAADAAGQDINRVTLGSSGRPPGPAPAAAPAGAEIQGNRPFSLFDVMTQLNERGRGSSVFSPDIPTGTTVGRNNTIRGTSPTRPFSLFDDPADGGAAFAARITALRALYGDELVDDALRNGRLQPR